jgi:hypothetical protein
VAASPHLRRVAAELAAAPARAARDTAAAGRTAADREGARWAPRGIKTGGGRRRLTATATVTGGGRAVAVTIAGDPAYGWGWAQDGTTPHRVGDRSDVLYGGYGHPVRGPVRHPGARGARVWDRARDATATEARRAWAATVDRATRG